MGGVKLEFWFDYASPYSYLASHRVEAVAQRHGAELLWRPFVLGGVFQAHGAGAPIQSSGKGEYILQDLEHLSEYLDIPYRPRREFIIRSVTALRATLQVPQGAERARAAHVLFQAAWGEDRDLADGGEVAGLLDQAGFDGQALVQGAQNPEVKQALKRETDEAIERGVFGAPTFFLDGERMFWGHDRLDVVDYYLARGQGE